MVETVRPDPAGAPADGAETVEPDTFTVTPVTGFGKAGLHAEWQKYCGFLDFTLPEFMEVQERLLQEQLDLIASSALGRKILKGRSPATLEEFRSFAPLTTYGDYVAYLGAKSSEGLAPGPYLWAHTTGAQADFKEVPYSPRGLERTLDNLMGAFILAAASDRGDINVRPGDTILYNTPERPYASGLVTFGMRERFGFKGVLEPEDSEHMDFRERIRLGFREALGRRVDIIVSMTSVLTKVGQGFQEQTGSTGFSRRLLRPRALLAVGKAIVKRAIMRRPIQPKDLWPVKAIIGWGIDSGFFSDQVERYWGRPPFEIYACTEGGVMGMQTWQHRGLVFSPYANLIEFIPAEESLRSREDNRFVPRTLLLSEVEPGKTYEVVITNFYGMAFLRYRVGHYVEFLPQDEQEPGCALPQFRFIGRADDRIDLAGFTRLDAKTMWEAVTKTSLREQEWAARKEFEGDLPVLHLYTEGKGDSTEREVCKEVHDAIRSVDPFYADLEVMLGIEPLRVTLLPKGSWDRFYDARRDAGYDVTQRVPPRMNATDEDVALLIHVGAE